MSRPGAVLAARISTDLSELALLVDRAKHGWEGPKAGMMIITLMA